MARYFIHLVHGDGRLADREGVELDGLDAVHARALADARFELSLEILGGRLTLDQQIVIEDERGIPVHSLPFADAFEIVPPVKHALIIESDGLVCMMIEEALRDMGYTSFHYALTESDALAAAAARCPDLITADVLLQDGCGVEAVRTICSGRRIPALFITEDGREALHRAPTVPVVRKPFTVAALNRAVVTALGCPTAGDGERRLS